MHLGAHRVVSFCLGSSILLTSLVSHTCFGQQPFVPAPNKPVPPQLPTAAHWHQPAKPRSLVGGLWRTDANFQSAIYLKNDVQTSTLSVTPVLYVSNGMRYALPAVNLAPAGTAIVDINAALQQQGIAAWATLSGYVEIDYSWPWDALCVTVRNVDPIHSELFNYGLVAGPQNLPPGQAAATQTNTVEGLWWKREPNVSAFVAVANVSSQPVSATLAITDAAAKPLGEQALTIPPHETKLVDIRELQSAATAQGGIRITYQGHGDELAVNGGLEDPAIGYSANIPFRLMPQAPAAPVELTYVESGLMAGAADPMMRFPAGTTFTPYSVLRNPSAQTISVTPALYWTQAAAPHSARLKPVTVAPYQALDLGVPALLAAAGLQHFNGEITLALDVQGPPHQILLAGGSVDRSGTYVFAVRPMAILESVAKSLSYWSIGNGDDTMVTLWNPADEAQDFVFTLFFSGGHYAFPVHMEGRVTRTFNVSEIVNSQIPDAEGNRIPPSVQEGSAELTGSQGESQHILVAMDAGTYNVRKATCGLHCITCNGATEFWIAANPFSVAVKKTTQLSFTSQYNTGKQYNLTSLGTWSSSNTHVATVNVGLVNGMAPGPVGTSASYASEPLYSTGCYSEVMECPLDEGADADDSGDVNGPPNGVSVLVDNEGFPSNCVTTGVYLRQMQMQIIDEDGNAVNDQTYSVQESQSFSINNTCGNGNPVAAACAPADSGNTFLDSMSVSGNLCGSGIKQSSGCGYAVTSTWSMCSSELSNSIWYSPRITKSNSVSVNGQTHQFAPGTELPNQ
jgi:hypothetical protein